MVASSHSPSHCSSQTDSSNPHPHKLEHRVSGNSGNQDQEVMEEDSSTVQTGTSKDWKVPSPTQV